MAPEQLEAVDEPKRTGQEDPLAGRQTVDAALVRQVSQDEAVPDQRPLDRIDRPLHSLVAGGEEADERNQEQARVEAFRTVRLRERRERRVVSAAADLGVDLVPKLAPPLDGPLEPVFLDGSHGSVECDPAHDLRMRELPTWPADLPQPLIRLAPRRLEVLEQLALQRPCRRLDWQSVCAALEQRVEHLAVDVELQLLARLVADTHRRRALVSGQPVELELRQPPLAADPVHDLEVGR